LKCDGRNRLRYGEDHMEVLSVEKFGSTVLQPLSASQRLAFWAVAISIALMTRRCAVHSEAPWISR
jgi:hypothetical protein